jgi:hypothetical protein
MKKLFLTFVALFFVSLNAQALFELRAGYGVQTPADDQVGANTLTSMGGFNLDAIVELPMVPVGLGLRYENLGSDLEFFGQAVASSTFERTSLIVNYRIIDLFLYFGLIGTLGLVNDYTAEFTGLGETKWDADLTYSVGVEGGVSLGLFMVGAELGYMAANLEANNQPDVDVSGIYAKALVGVGF